MSEQTGVDQNASVPIEALLGASFNLVIAIWESVRPEQTVDPGPLIRAPAIFEVIGWLTGHPRLDHLRKAVSTNNEHALGALVRLNTDLGRTCDGLMDRCKRWRFENEWSALRHEAGLATRHTAAAGRDAQSALA